MVLRMQYKYMFTCIYICVQYVHTHIYGRPDRLGSRLQLQKSQDENIKIPFEQLDKDVKNQLTKFPSPMYIVVVVTANYGAFLTSYEAMK